MLISIRDIIEKSVEVIILSCLIGCSLKKNHLAHLIGYLLNLL